MDQWWFYMNMSIMIPLLINDYKTAWNRLHLALMLTDRLNSANIEFGYDLTKYFSLLGDYHSCQLSHFLHQL